MDRIGHYRSAIHRVLGRFDDVVDASAQADAVKPHCAFDDDRNEYIVVRVGRRGDRRIKGIVLHIHLQDGKVWIEENSTDCEIADELIAQGIARDDIVFRFHHPKLREDVAAVA